MTPSRLLTAARELLREPSAASADRWPHMVALLARQALEKAMDEFWKASPATTGLVRSTGASQFTCLPFYLDPPVAREAGYMWAALSDACHYHAYELAPTAAELTSWLDAVTRLVEAMQQHVPSYAGRGHGPAGVSQVTEALW